MNLEEEGALIYSEIEEEGETEEALAASLAALGIDEDEELSTEEDEEEEEVSTQPGIQSSCKGIDAPSKEDNVYHHQPDRLTQNMLLMVPLKTKRTRQETHHQKKKRGKLWTIRDEANWACEQLQEKQYLLMAQIVNYLRFKRTRKLVKESQHIEALGGMMTADDTRKRSLGGIFFALLKNEVPADKIRKMRSNAGSRFQQKKTHSHRKRRFRQDQTPVAESGLQHALKVTHEAALKVRSLEK